VPAQPESDWDVVPVFYGTDRVHKDEPKRITYTADRASRLELGHALVTVPKSHQVPNIERPFAIRVPFINVTIYEQAEDPKQHFTIRELKALTRDEFIEMMRHLNLPRPKLIDVAVPANQRLGLRDGESVPHGA